MPELELPDYPEYFSQFLIWFYELNATRAYTDHGTPNPIPYREVMAWKELLNYEIRPSDVLLIRQIDTIYITTLITELGKR